MDITRPTVALISGRMIGAVATFAIPAVLARVFTPDDFGTYRQLFLIFTTAYVLGQFGLSECLYYFVPRGQASGGQFVANSTMALAVSGAVITLVLLVATPAIATWFDNPALASHMPLLAIFTGLFLFTAGLEVVMITRRRYVLAGTTYAMSDALRAAALVGPGILIGSVQAVMIGAVVFAGLRALYLLGFIRREFGAGLRPNRARWAEQVAYTLPFGAAVTIEVLQLYYHQYAVAAWFDPATFAIYSVACLQIPVVELIGTSSINVMMVAMSEREGDRRSRLALWHATIARLTMLFLPLVVLLFLVADDLIILMFTDAYAAAVPIFRVSLLFILLFAIPVDGALRVFARTRFILGMNLFRLAFIAATIGGFISVFGLMGAMLTPIVATALVKAAALWRIRGLLQVDALDLLPWRALAGNAAAVAVAAVPAWLVNTEFDLPRLASLIAVSATFGTVCLAMLALARLVPAAAPWLRSVPQERVG